MRSILTAIIGAIMVFALFPGTLLRLPRDGSKMTVAAVHAFLFGMLFFLVQRFAMQVFEGATTTCPKGQSKVAGKCVTPTKASNSNASATSYNRAQAATN